jgi:hypothetical protein
MIMIIIIIGFFIAWIFRYQINAAAIVGFQLPKLQSAPKLAILRIVGARGVSSAKGT